MIFGQKHIPLFWTVTIFQRRPKVSFRFGRTSWSTHLSWGALCAQCENDILRNPEASTSSGSSSRLHANGCRHWVGDGARGYLVPQLCLARLRWPRLTPKVPGSHRPELAPSPRKVSGIYTSDPWAQKTWQHPPRSLSMEAGASPQSQLEHFGVGLPGARTQAHLFAASNC